MKLQQFNMGQGPDGCLSDCPMEMEPCKDGGWIHIDDIKELFFFLGEARAFAIQMEWLSDGGELSDDAPGWVSLLIHLPTG